jgi:type IV secretory pathway VirB10-like protein
LLHQQKSPDPFANRRWLETRSVEERSMLKNIVIGVVTVAVLIVGWQLWSHNAAKNAQENGDVTSNDSRPTVQTDLDGHPVAPVGPTPSRSDAPGTINGEPVAGSTLPPPDAHSRIATMDRSIDRTIDRTFDKTAVPVSDTVAPNPPNGLAFGGTGKFQWYRQGSLTWRVNTESGSACIAFATLEEWRKPIVYTHGCGNS